MDFQLIALANTDTGLLNQYIDIASSTKELIGSQLSNNLQMFVVLVVSFCVLMWFFGMMFKSWGKMIP